jgi:hypothetical protein
MRRRAFIRIISPGHIRVSTSIDTKDIKHDPKVACYVDLVGLSKIEYVLSKYKFYCHCRESFPNGYYTVEVKNSQNVPVKLGELSTAPGADRSGEFRVIIIEDD